MLSINPQQKNVVAAQPLAGAEMFHLRRPIDQAQVTQPQRLVVAEPYFVAAHRDHARNHVRAQTLLAGEMSPLLAIEARNAVAAAGPQHAITGNYRMAGAAASF